MKTLKTFLILIFFSIGFSLFAQENKTDKEEIWKSKNEQVTALFNQQRYEEAIPMAEDALNYVRKELGENNPNFLISINKLADLYQNSEAYSKALPLYLEAKDKTETILGNNSQEYGFCLNNLILCYESLGEYEKAISLSMELIDNIKNTVGKNHPNYAIALNNLAEVYLNLGQFDKSFQLFTEAIDIIEQQLGKNSEKYGLYLNNLASLYKAMGEYDKALPLYKEAVDNAEKILGKNHPVYGSRLKNLAGIYESIGSYDKALSLYLEAKENMEKNQMTNQSDYGILLHNLAGVYIDTGEYDKAMTLALESKRIIENTLGINHPDYQAPLNILAILYMMKGDFDNALKLMTDALNNAEKTLGKNHPRYATLLNNLASFYKTTGNIKKAIPLFIESKDITAKLFGKDHPDYAERINSLANAYWSMGDFDKILPLAYESIENKRSQINRIFKFTSEKEKEEFITKSKFEFDSYQSFFKIYYHKKPEVSGSAYDLELMMKGLVLNSGLNLRNRIEATQNETLKQKYESLMTDKKLLGIEYAKPIAERRTDLKELENNTESLESEINQQTNLISSGSDAGNVSWQDIQKKLGKNEVAIEFSFFRYYSGQPVNDSTQLYIALILKKDDKQPVLIPLFGQSHLDRILSPDNDRMASVNQLYRGSIVTAIGKNQDGRKLYDLIWKPLEPYIPQGSVVYFAPSGTLHQIAFPAIRTPDGKYLSDLYELHQLNSTAGIIEKESNVKIKDIVLFGGIDYDATNAGYKVSSKIESTNSENGSWNYLPGTLTEVKEIEKEASLFKIQTTLYSGNQAKEEKFKALNGNQSPTVLHIATHGFFFPDTENTEGQNNNQVFSSGDNPLNRAGLLFSGANNSWDSSGQNIDTEDGILTAYEANNVYLQNTRLTVLSACETGLGDIKGSEGVYGLQRAFKAAGSEYLLMSLWQVPDAETAEFMSYFYQELFKTNDIENSYTKTLKMMREKYVEEPFKWAAFVLVR